MTRRNRWKWRWLKVRNAYRWVLNLECTEPQCHARRRCWPVHDETMICPTCKTVVSEDDPRWPVIFQAIMDESKARGLTGSTGTHGPLSMTSSANIIVRNCWFV